MTEFAQQVGRLAWRYWPATAGLAALCLNLFAIVGVEIIAGMEPCPLCLAQRNVYWAVAAISLLSAPIWLRAPQSQASRAVASLLAGGFLTSVVVAGYHAGVEWSWWRGPACTGTIEGFDPTELESAMNVVACDQAPYRFPEVPWGLSMAGQNALAAAGLAVLSLLSAVGARPGIEEAR